MIIIVTCANCDNDGPMPASITYDYRVDICGACHHRDAKTYSYHFCSFICMAQYLDKFRNGLPCQSCHHTGFGFGFRENGPCLQCGGRGLVPAEMASVFAELKATTEIPRDG